MNTVEFGEKMDSFFYKNTIYLCLYLHATKEKRRRVTDNSPVNHTICVYAHRWCQPNPWQVSSWASKTGWRLGPAGCAHPFQPASHAEQGYDSHCWSFKQVYFWITRGIGNFYKFTNGFVRFNLLQTKIILQVLLIRSLHNTQTE